MKMYPRARRPIAIILGLVALFMISLTSQHFTHGGNTGNAFQYPWLDRTLSPDARADLVLKQMTLDEKLSLLHGTGWHGLGTMNLEILHSNGGVGYVVGIPRLRIPGIQMTNASYGVTRSRINGRYSTALPDDLALAATWDADAAYEYGALLGRELRAQGYNMSLGGGVNLAREPRDGRTFEYLGEDPILAGTIAGQEVAGTQAQHVIGDMKHYAMNDRESDRKSLNVNIDKRAMRESDLLAFEIGLRNSEAGAVMCAYNEVNGEPSCENQYLLAQVLRKDWKYPGFVLSDWGATHSTVRASAAGLDNEEPSSVFYGKAMKRAVLAGKVPMADLDQHVRRILRSEFASGIVDDPPVKGPIDVDRDLNIAQHLAEESIVLLRNEDAQLPLDGAKLRTIAVIGAHADIAMISGGGSGQVDPPAGSAIRFEKGLPRRGEVWFPTSPLKAIAARAPRANVEYDPGTNPAAAAALARPAEVAIVFVYQWESEDMDLATLSLPGNQDALVEQVAAANPHTIVVLETGSPALMPWANKVSAILEAWYAGSRGADAVANVLFGDVNPCAKLPITFPLRDVDMPQPAVVQPRPSQNGAFAHLAALFGGDGKERTSEQLYYNQGMLVGYKWYDARQVAVLFPFGFGLSYTKFHYSGLHVKVIDNGVSVNFTIKNTGNQSGAEVAEVYASFPPSAGEPPKRLIGWQKTQLNPGESKQVSLRIQTQYLSILDVEKDEWSLIPGEYTLSVGGSSESLPLRQRVSLER